VAALDEVLAALDARLPALGPGIASLARETERLEEAAQQLLASCDEKRAAAEALAARAREALARVGGAGQAQALQAQAHALRAAADRARDSLTAAADALVAQARTTGSAMDGLTGRLMAASQGAREAHQAGAAATLGEEERWQAGLADLREASRAADLQAGAVVEAVGEARSTLEGDLATLGGTMTTLRESAHGAVAGLVQALRARGAAHEGRLQEITDELAAGKAALLAALHRCLAQEVRQRLGGAVENAGLALDALADEARSARQALVASRRELAAELEEVRQAKRPLPGAVKQVRTAADRVGVRWA
jgi:hypothetical protein